MNELNTSDPFTESQAQTSEPPLLEVDQLRKHFPLQTGLLDRLRGRSRRMMAVDGVSFSIQRGETLGMVGESGCGKTTTGLSVLQLAPPSSGDVRFDGKSIVNLPYEKNRQLRQNMQMILQNPYSSLNPRMRIGEIIREPLRNFSIGDGASQRETTRALIEQVGLHPEHLERYPHEFSGGQRQRIGIARALALQPSLIVADEPVSALDVSVQAQILNLLLELKAAFNLTFLFISHDISVVRYVSDRIAVMYLGKIAEIGPASEICNKPQHPYTQALMSAVPLPDPHQSRQRIRLTGNIPSPADPPSGCRFHTRCSLAEPRCSAEEPTLRELVPGHQVACHFAERTQR